MKIGVLLSGGIDSLYTTILLKKMNHEVIGIYGSFFHSPNQNTIWENLKLLSKTLNFELHKIELHSEFQKLIIKPFIKDYIRGLTPNPCALCNPKIKFGLLLQKALKLGVKKIASGHYAKIITKNNNTFLFRGDDPTKEQSYFLSLLPQATLSHLLFPLGELKKQDVVQKIKEYNLFHFTTKESNEVCFIPSNYREFLQSNGIHLDKPGPIKLLDETLLGTHKGLWNYTLGQRRGIGIPYKEPLYVLKKDISTNTLYVGIKKELQAKSVVGINFNFLEQVQNWPSEIYIQIRYRQKAKKAILKKQEKDTLYFEFKEQEEKPAPGQILAVYTKEGQVLGGGIIKGEF
ncbi:tRNA-specific 2-thiouridylase [Desulfonauticus submarinus]|uniref:tRNA-specific 2-thiouridylase MnmA n=1 Tax=Desulfonauticus submarinus TaxID=206665 RepID=A0A1H0CLY5_9BACT|nr:tRNA 2-thiouridine(34) synthase MnmA [Desulfonauticus submarinus]SDN58852.1 tRNA-specific 2-thiouridylase [Desulfonauticus submarinus]